MVELTDGTKVRAIETKNEVNAGDTGVVIAAWTRPTVLVRWDKDGASRRIHRKRLETL